MGYLSDIPRGDNGYRQYTAMHLEQARLARLTFTWPYVGDKELLLGLVRSTASGDFGGGGLAVRVR